MLTNSEYQFMKGIENGGIVKTEESNLARSLEINWLVRVGYNDEGIFCETASLTDSGKRAYQRERIRRNPVRYVLNAIFEPIFGAT